MARKMALQQIIDKKQRCGIFNPFCLVFFQGQILSAAPLKIVPSQAKFEKAQKKAFPFCYALMMRENLSVSTNFSLEKKGPVFSIDFLI